MKKYFKAVNRLNNLEIKFNNFTFTGQEQISIYKEVLSLKDTIEEQLRKLYNTLGEPVPAIGEKFSTKSLGELTLLARGTFDDMINIEEVETNIERAEIKSTLKSLFPDDNENLVWYAYYAHDTTEIVYFPSGKQPK